MIHLGHRSYINRNHYHLPLNGEVFVGRYTSIGYGCTFLAGEGHTHKSLSGHVSNFPFDPDRNYGTITIGNDVWIGAGATLLGGVTVGDGAIIGAQSLIAEPVPPYGITAGNPARLLRHRFTPVARQALLEIQWWNWDDQAISARFPAPDIFEFLKKYHPAFHESAYP